MAWIEHDGVLYNLDNVTKIRIELECLEDYFLICISYINNDFDELSFKTEKERDEYFDNLRTYVKLGSITS